MAGVLKILGILTAFAANLSQTINLPPRTPQASLGDMRSIKTIVEGLGVVYESYNVVTEDGYILLLNRMVNPKLRNRKDKGVPVLLVNGLAMWSEAWLIQPVPVDNPPVAWLVRGYDVWLGDARGTWRTRKHKTLSPLWWKFWDFSFHEMGVYDLPAFIDFILNKTGHKKLAFSGISNSAAQYYALCSEKPHYQDKLYGAILFAPVAETTKLSSLRWAAYMNVHDGGLLMQILWIFGIGACPPLHFTMRKDIYRACRFMTPELYMTLNRLIMGSGCKFQKDIFCAQIATAFGGTSVKTMVHTSQLFRNGGKFCKYDYGFIGNLAKYGQMTPPEYNVSRVRVPTALYSMDTDVWVPSRVVERVAKRLRGPRYECVAHGVCHIFHMTDARAAPFIKDSSYVLDSMTGRTNSSKIRSRKCKVKW